MHTRRLLSLFSSLFMLHLTLVASDVVCAEHRSGDAHGAHDRSDVAPASHQPHRGSVAMPEESEGRGEHHAGFGSSHGAQGELPCQVPTRPQCCDAMAGCTMSIAVSRGSNPDSRFELMLGVAGNAARHLQSRGTGPEPPPPRV